MAKIHNDKKSDSFTFDEASSLIKDLRHLGYLLPTNDEELKTFDETDSPIEEMPAQIKSGDFLFKKAVSSQKSPVRAQSVGVQAFSKSKRPQPDYFKKIVLAADIAFKLHSEPTFGHKKFVKILYLCEELGKMELSTNYGKFAAGPLDPKLMYSIDAEFKKQNWFNIVKREGYGYKYEPLESVDKYKSYFANYYRNEISQIDYLIELFRKEKSDFCEIVATIFYVWKEYSQKTILINDNALIAGFYKWDKSKERFDESTLKEAIAWMIANNVCPVKIS